MDIATLKHELHRLAVEAWPDDELTQDFWVGTIIHEHLRAARGETRCAGRPPIRRRFQRASGQAAARSA
jgi:hypothetical protein